MPEPCADCRTPVPVGYNRCLPCTAAMLANLPTFTLPTLDACRELTAKHEAFKWADIARKQQEEERWREKFAAPTPTKP